MGASKGSGSVYKLPSGRYRARLKVNSQPFSATFDTEKAAKDWLRDTEADVRRGLVSTPTPTSAPPVPTVAALWEQYKAGWQVAPSTQRYYSTCWGLLEPVVGNVLAIDVKPSEMPALRTYLLGKVGTTRAKGSVQLLGRLLHLAEVDGIVARNAVDVAALRWPRQAPKDRPVLTPQEVLALATHAKHDRDRVLLLLLGWGGLRIGEGFGLQRRDVDLTNGTVTLRRSVSDPAGALTVGDTKMHKVRTVTLPGPVVEALRTQLATVPIQPDAWVFPSRAGGALRYRAWTRDVWVPTVARWENARKGEAERLNATPPVEFELEPHDLRSSCASLLIDAGASVKDVQAHLGHADISTTLNIYARVRPGKQAELAARMDALIAGV